MNIENKNYLGIILVGLAIIIFWVFILPIWDRISLLNEAIPERENMLSSTREILKKIDELNTQYQERSSDVARISSVVPNAKSSAELVSTVEAISQQTGLQLVEIITSGSDDQQQELQTIFIELGLAGNYPSLTAFLELLEKNLRIVDVPEITIAQTSVLGGQASLNFRVKASAYYLNVKN